jgi:hypothetical protein
VTNTSGKVTVSREVAESIEKARQHHDNEWFVDGYYSGAVSAYPGLFGLPLDTLIRALYIGYEVERSPEEDVANYIAVLRKKTAEDYGNTHWQDELIGAQTVIYKLGIQLPEPTEGADAN